MMRIAFIPVLTLAVLTAGCSTGAKFLEKAENTPKWFLDKIPEIDREGYPSMASAPAKPGDVQSLANWDKKLEALQTKGEELTQAERDQRGDDTLKTPDFLSQNRELADVDKFNEEEAAADAAAIAAGETNGH
ncbi:hypothetical protein MNBD_ALPHA06-1116 [hydrothermal vent metagenome]|uniref:Lipoprotein n=1 Tax=hydrothermal vent metagenome TaxID=652676 RepID=A0A3B0RJD2_9ZZZZ